MAQFMWCLGDDALAMVPQTVVDVVSYFPNPLRTKGAIPHCHEPMSPRRRDRYVPTTSLKILKFAYGDQFNNLNLCTSLTTTCKLSPCFSLRISCFSVVYGITKSPSSRSSGIAFMRVSGLILRNTTNTGF